MCIEPRSPGPMAHTLPTRKMYQRLDAFLLSIQHY